MKGVKNVEKRQALGLYLSVEEYLTIQTAATRMNLQRNEFIRISAMLRALEINYYYDKFKNTKNGRRIAEYVICEKCHIKTYLPQESYGCKICEQNATNEHSCEACKKCELSFDKYYALCTHGQRGRQSATSIQK